MSDDPATTGPAGRAEFALLVACASRDGEALRAARVRACLGRPLDWGRLLDLGKRHGVVGLLWQGLAAAGETIASPGALDAVRAEAWRLAFRNLELSAELIRLLGILEASAIPAIPYKGPTLAIAAYGNVALRAFADLDVIVPRERVPDVRGLLVAEGYRPLVTLAPAREAAYLRSHYDYAFRRDADGTVVEVHWALEPRYSRVPFEFARLLARLEAVPLGGATVQGLAPGDLLPLLCVHGARHLWERLEWVSAIAGLVARHADLDWGGVLERAVADRTERMLLVGLGLARELCRAPLPASVLARVARRPRVGRLIATFRGRLERGEAGLPGVLETARLHLALRERLRDRIRYCVGGAFSPSERDWADTRTALHRFAGLLRPLRLVRDYGLSRRKPHG